MSVSIHARGPISDQFMTVLAQAPTEAAGSMERIADTVRTELASGEAQIASSDDLQLVLLLSYGLSYGSPVTADDRWEWHPAHLAVRALIESQFESQLRADIQNDDLPPATAEDVATYLFELTRRDDGPSLSRFLAKNATDEQAREFVIHRSIYTLREADPHSWAIPRLTGRAKAALVEVQSDEYGGGRPERVHATIFARTMHALGLDETYGAYVDAVPAITLASFNMMSMFGINRRLRGAIAGHLAAFEMTSSIPNRMYSNGFRRLGYDADVTHYFDEHVEADAVHEQIAGRDLAGGLAEDHPELLPDIIFGAKACLYADGLVGRHILERWEAGKSSLRAMEVKA